jgi:uncharacterized membrane protein YbjE (DUF340 family)
MPAIAIAISPTLSQGVGAPAGFGWLTLAGKLLTLSTKNLMLRNS